MSEEMITVKLQEKELRFPKGISVLQCIEDSGIKTSYPVYGAKVNNEMYGLSEALEEDAVMVLVDGTSEEGRKIYRRSLCLVMIRAFKELFPEGKVMVFHSLSGGYYCRPALWRLFTKKDMKALRARMEEIISRDEPLLRQILTRDEALNLFEQEGQLDKVKLIQYSDDPTLEVYRTGSLTDSLFGKIVPRTGYLKVFELLYYPPGFILRFPRSNNPLQLSAYSEQNKLFKVYYEYKNWVTLMGVSDVSSLNEVISSGETNDLIRVAEALHEKKIAAIADLIANNKEQLRLVLIAGPSSSGKTTFAQRLAVQLRVNGIKPVAISLDNYFLDRDHTPRDEKGDYNFEILEALDLELFNETLHKLLAGEEVKIPRFDFAAGTRVGEGSRLKIRRDQPVIVEGIHCLNEKLTEYIARDLKFKIYVSALTQLNLDDHNRISTTDTRVLRRIVRDRQFRGRDALGTLKRWDSVRRGEREHIFPFQEEADVMFNSALVYELSVLKNFVEEPLLAIDRSEPEYSEAQRLLFTLKFFSKIGTDEIPPNSILREFIGATCFIRAEVP
jgi:uridine kinase